MTELCLLNYLTSVYVNECDLYFFIDKNQCWYHNGIHGITNNIDDTVIYLNNIISNYEKVLFMGTSAGGMVQFYMDLFAIKLMVLLVLYHKQYLKIQSI